MKVRHNDSSKLAQPFVRKNSGSCTMCINVQKKCAKNEVFDLFSTLVARIDSISHMMVVLNVSQHMEVVKGHAQLIRYA